ncbi:MAG TPA: hypothetical protein PK014_11235 [Thermoanaerobaculia bacterium]|nr:hypothetical protein [Thermoanaerobaculia bacterium]HUM30696.1 hypothetical protein [Thermoanaerobaculia bacterium]HXK68896.1 hypothetical protein [Thermoanaerobaculia bacterium]
MVRPPRWVILMRSFMILFILVALFLLYVLNRLLLRILSFGS